MKTWIRLQLTALRHALAHVLYSPGGFFLNALVVAISLALPFAGLTLLDNVGPVTQRMAVQPEISVFFAPSLSSVEAAAFKPQIDSVIAKYNSRASMMFVSRANALELLKKRNNNMTEALAALDENPLPDSYIITLTGLHTDAQAQQTSAIAEDLRKLKQIDAVQVDSEWVKRLAAILNVFRLVLVMLAFTLAVVVVAVIFNTVRLQVMTQQAEIAAARIVGATDSFIHRPFFYTGALLGLCSGVVALGLVALSLPPLNESIATLAHLYASEFQLVPLSPLNMALLLLVSAGLGLLGSLLSVRKHLAAHA